MYVHQRMKLMLNADWAMRGSALSLHPFGLGIEHSSNNRPQNRGHTLIHRRKGKEGGVLYGMSEEIPGRMAIARPSALALHGLHSGLGLEERGKADSSPSSNETLPLASRIKCVRRGV